MKTVYMFELRTKGIERTVVECEEKPKTYIPTNGAYYTRIRKEEIGAITGVLKNRVFLLEDNVKKAAIIFLNNKKRERASVEKKLSELERTVEYLESMSE